MKRQVNPYLPTYEYVPDGEPHVFDGRLYIFGSHDRFNGEIYCENDYVCWSASIDDLSSWTYHGCIYQRKQDPLEIKFLQNHLWAPDVMVGKDGRYYLYYGTEFYNRIAVCVSDSPAGKYEFLGEVHYKDGTRFGGRDGEVIRFDPGVINDNGRYYLYTGFSSDKMEWVEVHAKVKIEALGCTVCELEDDMLTIKEEAKPLIPGVGNSAGTTFVGHEFFEASSIRKFNDTYYFIYSSILSHELCYAYSKYPDKDFVFGGILHSNGNVINNIPEYFYGNNHGSIECVNGKYYIFGHRQTNGNEASRQGVVEHIEYKDGKFGYAEMTCLGFSESDLAMEGSYEAGIACVLKSNKGAFKITSVNKEIDPYITQIGEDREDNPMQYISNFSNGCIAGYKYFDSKGGKVSLSLHIKNHNDEFVNGYLMISDNEDFSNKDEKKIECNSELIVDFELSTQKKKMPLYIKFVGEGRLDIISLDFNK